MTESSLSSTIENQTLQDNAEEAEEIQWTDDKIRWDEDENSDAKNHNDHDEDRCAYIDPFKDNDPFDTFSFRYPKNLDTPPAFNTTVSTKADIDTNSNNYFIK